jgi:hypothetical protein
LWYAPGTGRRKGQPYCVGQNGVVVGQDGRPDCREAVRRQYCELGRPPPADRPLGQSRALVLPACAYLPEGSGRCPSLGRRLAAIEPFLVS